MSSQHNDDRTNPRQPAAREPFPTVEFTPEGHLSAETLAAWLDDAQSFRSEDAERVRAHLEQDATSRQTLAELRLVVATLGNLPEITPSRSFTLTTQAARTVRPPVLQTATRRDTTTATGMVQVTETSAWQRRQQRTLRWASAVAALLLVFVLGVDAFNGSTEPTTSKNTITFQSDLPPASGGSADEFAVPESYAPIASPAAGEADDESSSGGAGAGSAEDATTMEQPAGEATDASGTGAESEAQPESAEESEMSEDAPEGGASDSTGAGNDAGTGTDTDTARSAETTSGEDDAAAESAAGTGPAALETTPAPETNAAADTLASEESLREDMPLTTSSEAEDEGDTTLRLLEYGLAMAAIWLLIAMLALPHLRQRSSVRRH